MEKMFWIAFLLVMLATITAHADSGYCGDDVCGTGESCGTCQWDCGICPNETEGSGGVIITPAPKVVSVPGEYYGYIECPITYLSHIISGGYNTTVRIRFYNPSSSSTGQFRLRLSSTLGWFVPKNMTYALAPDAYDANGWPYWDMPPMGRNESTEISFTVKGSVGLVNMVDLHADELERWGEDCPYFVPKSGSELQQNISQYLDYLNWSQDVRVYYRSSNLVLAYLDKKGSLAVLRLNHSDPNSTKINAVSDYGTINSLVSQYIAAATPAFSGNVAKPQATLNYSKSAKADDENECMAITGMDKHECVNRTTCQLACASVPVCWHVGQVGWPFIDTMLDYKVKVNRTNTALEQAITSASAFRQAPSKSTAEVALADIEALNRNETEVIYQPIFTTYNFCPPPDYAIPQMIDARRQLLDYISNSCLEDEKGGIVGESAAIGPALESAERDAAIRESAMLNASTAANASMNATGNMSANATVNATGMNATGNATINGTIGANTTTNLTGNTTGNMSISQNMSNITAIASQNATTNTSANETEAQTVSVPGVPCKLTLGTMLFALLVVCIGSTQKKP